jgi:hypothetical protein
MSPAQSQTAARPRLRPRPTTERGSPAGVAASLTLHVLAVAALLFSFRGFVPPGENSAVPVDLVIAEETNVAAAAAPQQAPEPEKFERPALEPMAPPPEPDIAEPAPVDVKPPEIKIAEPEKPAPKNDINALLNQLTKAEPAPRNARTASRAADAAGAGTMATASLADALRSQIRNCWSPIPGAPNPADQVVSFGLRLNQDGSVAKLELLTLNGNAYTSAAAEAASRAIYQCQPYHLPPERYAQWQEFRPLRFDPRQMLPQ